ncbi:sensor histidine kinase [Roseateles sp. DXS20W]|uniref:histidine kinase n=1 Tax=Pelomonas lactea TaxID=3299030 RepID=A0ABW7GMX4_9BURK
MRLGPVDVTLADMPRLGLAAFRNRIVFHLVFIALALATLALALALLNEERQRNAQRYEQTFAKSLAEVVAQLRHPSGQLALLNPEPAQVDAGWVAPLVLPFGAIDFDDATKAQRAIEMAGCSLQYPGGASLCAAVGSNAYAGGFVYLVASLDAPPLVSRERGALDIADVHRVRVSLQRTGTTQHWLAPVEMLDAQRGQLPGFTVEAADDTATLPRKARPQRDFRGWVWREGPCLAAGETGEPCPRRTTVSLRVPVEAFREALFRPGGPQWPPADLPRTGLRLALLGPGGATLFDSAAPGSQPPLTLARLSGTLSPGETLKISRGNNTVVALLQGADDTATPPSPWLTALIQHLPAPATPRTLTARDTVTTPAGRFEVTLTGDLQGLDRSLSASAARLAWPVGAMLAALALAWLIIEMGLIRRVATLTKRAAALSHQLQQPGHSELGTLDVAGLRGRDELGILAGTLADLLQHARDSLRREQLRAEREHDQWHAVGHEIMSPLQSLMLLHAGDDDPSRRYVQRMQQAVKVLYGQASPSEALAAATLAVGRLDLDAFLRQVAENAAYAGIADVVYTPSPEPVWVQADEYPLEDALTHVLTNADRYRVPGTPVTLALRVDGELATVDLHNQGPQIPDDQLARIFDYGVSDAPPEDGQRRGQGLFVAKTYLAKMGGSIAARNVADGVVFEIGLRRL